MGRVLVPPAVEADIERIGDYIAARHSPQAGRSLVTRLHRRCQTLSSSPQRGAQYDARRRYLVEGSYRIFYRIEETADETLVVIVAVVHGSRDIERVLPSP